MTTETHSQIGRFIWDICNLLRGPYKRIEYRNVILPLTVLRRFDCILAPTKAEVLKELAAIFAEGESPEAGTYKDYLQVRSEGRREVSGQLRLCRLEAILAVGYRVLSHRGT